MALTLEHHQIQRWVVANRSKDWSKPLFRICRRLLLDMHIDKAKPYFNSLAVREVEELQQRDQLFVRRLRPSQPRNRGLTAAWRFPHGTGRGRICRGDRKCEDVDPKRFHLI